MIKALQTAVLAIAAGGLLSISAHANTIQILDIMGDTATSDNSTSQYPAPCADDLTVCMEAFYQVEDDPLTSDDETVPLNLSTTLGTGYEISSSDPGVEAVKLNELISAWNVLNDPDLDLIEADKTAVGGPTKMEIEDDKLKTSFEWFSIKKGDYTTYFRNLTGGEVSVSWSPDDYSHWTTYGGDLLDPPDEIVPIPAAVWLFGSALLGVIGIGYRRKQEA